MQPRLPCFDRNCREPVRHRLLDLNMCTAHYIEALEHCAHIVLLDAGKRAAIAAEQAKRRAEILSKITKRHEMEKRKRENLTGRAEIAPN